MRNASRHHRPTRTQTDSEGHQDQRVELIATTEHWRGKDDKVHQHTEWHRIVFFGPQAGQLANFLHKGSFVEVEGSIRSRNYEKYGVSRVFFEIRGTDYSLQPSL